MNNINIKTKDKKQVVDLTSKVNQIIKKQRLTDGILYLFTKHTTCSLTIADLDPGTDQDYLNAIEKIFPKGNYNHPHNPTHVGDHIMSSVIGHSVMIPIKNGKTDLGTWQSIVLIELNGPRTRNLVWKFI